MSLTAIALNGLLAILLLIALAFGVRLERRLKALRDSHEGFAKAVADLDRAAMRAEQGLADLRAATDEAADTLADRITKAKALAAQLDERLDRPMVTPPPSVRPAAEPRRRAALGRRAASDPRTRARASAGNRAPPAGRGLREAAGPRARIPRDAPPPSAARLFRAKGNPAFTGADR
jgi:hypothetical protein